MTRLFRFKTRGEPGPEVLTTTRQLVGALAPVGIDYARWSLAANVEGARPEELKILYKQQLDELTARFGYQAIDVVQLTPEDPNAGPARQKYLAEHTHGDDEARYFAEGGGTFYLHYPERALLLALCCTAGDWVRIPAGTRHWFDMGERPFFSALRLFTRPDGWVASFTGSDVATTFPTHDALTST
jgi:1,2-dihydroxy-3-keto-5-methylthiopentene dioxygenase